MRIKELGTIIYSVKDLKSNELNNAINNFVQKCVSEIDIEEAHDSIYDLTDEEIIEILDYNNYFFDKAGNIIPTCFSVNNDGKYSFQIQLTNCLSSEITLEFVQEGNCNEEN